MLKWELRVNYSTTYGSVNFDHSWGFNWKNSCCCLQMFWIISQYYYNADSAVFLKYHIDHCGWLQRFLYILTFFKICMTLVLLLIWLQRNCSIKKAIIEKILIHKQGITKAIWIMKKDYSSTNYSSWNWHHAL